MFFPKHCPQKQLPPNFYVYNLRMCVFVCMGTHGDQTTTLDVVPQDTVSLVFEDKIAQFYLEFANLVRMAPATSPPPPCMSVCVWARG